MPDARDLSGATPDGAPPRTWWQRLSKAMLKPVDPAKASVPTKPAPPRSSADELRAEAKSANDKERLIGLIVAPIAAAIGILVVASLVGNDPPALLANGQANKSHVSVSRYQELLVVFLVLSVAMLASAWFRKRLYLGILTALYGLALFNLHYWGFGVPFLMVGSWYLVRSYRLQRDLKEATAGRAPSGRGPKGPTIDARAKPSSRYTPPVSRKTASPKPKRPNRQRAG
jgi:hypothetical protein